MVLLISYEIKNKSRDLTALKDTIKSAKTWWHHMGNVWIVQTDLSPDDWYKKLVKHIYRDDNLLIIRVNQSFSGWLPQTAWEWLNKRTYE